MSMVAALILAAGAAGQVQQVDATASGPVRARATVTASVTILRSARVSLRDAADGEITSVEGDEPVYRQAKRTDERVLIEFQ